VSETPIDENKFQVKARTKEHKLNFAAKQNREKAVSSLRWKRLFLELQRV